MPPEMLPRDGYQAIRAIIPERVLRGMRTSQDVHEYLQARVSRRTVLKGLGLAGLAVAAGPVLWSKPGRAAEPPKGLHLAYGDDPQRSMSVSWYTQNKVAKPVVEFGPDASYGAKIDAISTTYPDVQGAPITIQHHATMKGLEPGKTYHYRVRHDGGQSEDFVFATAPSKLEPFTFTTFGDHGSAPQPGRFVSATWGTPYSPVAVETVEGIDPVFHLHAGDLSYSCGGPQEAWEAWFDEITPRASKMPWMVTLGNHEMETGFGPNGYDPFKSRFRLPSNGIDWTEDRTSTFYAFQYLNVLVIALDGNEAAWEAGYRANTGYLKGGQDRWLEATLKTARADQTIDWIVASFHNCMYCTDVVHASDGGNRARWQAMFEKYQVDLVINGHNHCYERTYPIVGSEYVQPASGEPVDPTTMGVTYLCAGGGGQLAAPRSASTYPVGQVNNESGEREDESALWRATRFDGYSLAAIDIDPGAPGGRTTLTLRGIEFTSTRTSEIDRVVLERPAKAASVPVVPPPPPPPPPPPTEVKGARELAPTGVGAGVAGGTATLAAAAALRRLLRDDATGDATGT